MKKKTPEKSGARRVWAASMALAVLLMVLANLCAALMTGRLGAKFDLTENKLYALSDTTMEIIGNLETPVTIQVFNNRTDFLILIREILDRYQRGGNMITVRYADPYANPRLVQGYKDEGYEIGLNSVAVVGGGQKKVFAITDLYDIDPSTQQVNACIAEQVLTSAISAVAAGHTRLVQFTDGHDERPSAGLMEIFESNNFEIQRTAVAITGIDSRTDLLVIAAPTRDFEDRETQMIGDYLLGGGRLMVFLPPASTAFPNLTQLLREWGISVSDGVVREPQLFMYSDPVNVAATYVAHPITEFFSKNRYYVVSPSSRALSQEFMQMGSIATRPVLTSSSKSYAKSEIETGDPEKREGDAEGPFLLAVTAERDNGTDPVARIFCMGSSGVYGDDLLSARSLANRDLLIQAAGWLAEDEPLFHIPAKNLNLSAIGILDYQVGILGLLLILVVPLAVVCIGVVVYLRRRHL